ncbi:MAG: transcription elongation factor GreA [Candidatus Pacebacteria bacterium]|nr:transcription elongation factor GreA [Candidatus Paceibacterota bacterium]
MTDNYITPEGLEELKKELNYLNTEKTKEIADLIKHTASFGDLKENFAYHDAKEKQAFLQKRILELKDRIRNAKIIEKKKSNVIEIGSDVLIDFDGKKQKITIVGSEQADPIKGRISYESPLGQAILTKSKGDKVKIDINGEKIECKIIKIE